ncbi:unnamed protein product [Gordionus sp. m RMFG-2023]
MKIWFSPVIIIKIILVADAVINVDFYKGKVKQMFIHAYDSYMKYAYPLDELKPISCSGMNTWGNFSLTLIDSLDTLLVMGNETEFMKAVNLILNNVNFNMNINVSVFETNIRVVGGLLGAHFLSGHTEWGRINGFPCKGPLLDLAKDLADKLMPAFNTATGLPYGTVNLLYGIPPGETPVTCTAAAETFALEFFALSAITGDSTYREVAMKSSKAMWNNHRSALGLVGNHINTHTGAWVGKEIGIGSGVDSYFEYLLKGALLSRDPTLMKQFLEYEKVINRYLNYNGWYFWANMENGNLIWPIFQSLEAFWPGLLVSLGRIAEAETTFKNYHKVWIKYGSLPETFNVVNGKFDDGHSNYPLRPEFIESAYHLYKATGDSYYLKVGIDVIQSLEILCKTECGYAVLKDVGTHAKDDRMESFFLAETLKYLYLLFDTQPNKLLYTMNSTDHDKTAYSQDECMVTSGGYLLNTEAHPIQISAVQCCGIWNNGQPFQGEMMLDKNESDENETWYSSLNTSTVKFPAETKKAMDDISLQDLLDIMNGDYSALESTEYDFQDILLLQNRDQNNRGYVFIHDDLIEKPWVDLSNISANHSETRNLKNAESSNSLQLRSPTDIVSIFKDLVLGNSIETNLLKLVLKQEYTTETSKVPEANTAISKNSNKVGIDAKLVVNDRSYDLCERLSLNDLYINKSHCLSKRWALENVGGFELAYDKNDPTSETKRREEYLRNCLFKCSSFCCPYNIPLSTEPQNMVVENSSSILKISRVRKFVRGVERKMTDDFNDPKHLLCLAS